MSFTITFDELKKLSDNLIPSDSLNRIVPDINSSIAKFHNTLESRVGALYKSKQSLGSVRLSSGLTSKGTLSLDYSIAYKDSALPMTNYDYKQSAFFKVKNSIPFGLANGFVRYKKVNKARSVRVSIRNSGSPSTPRVRTEYKKFLGNVKGKERILVRLQKATWLQIPNVFNPDGTRAPYKELFGPSLAKLANITYDKDSQMETARDVLANEVITAFSKGW
jgi:hypothetical protein